MSKIFEFPKVYNSLEDSEMQCVLEEVDAVIRSIDLVSPQLIKSRRKTCKLPSIKVAMPKSQSTKSTKKTWKKRIIYSKLFKELERSAKVVNLPAKTRSSYLSNAVFYKNYITAKQPLSQKALFKVDKILPKIY